MRDEEEEGEKEEAAGGDEWGSRGLAGLLVTLNLRRQVAFCPSPSSLSPAEQVTRASLCSSFVVLRVSAIKFTRVL